MRVAFSQNNKYVLFIHENAREYKFLLGFPAFIRIESYNACEKILPIVFNVVNRLQTEWKKVSIDADVYSWLNSEFKLEKLPSEFKFHTKPIDFQEIALRYVYTLGSAGILLDPGMGKSKIVLDYIVLKGFKKVLIVCPAPLLFVWEDEILIHRPELKNYYIVQSTNWEQEKNKIEDAEVIIINYTKVSLLKHRLKTIGWEYIHLDEFSIKDPKTDRTKSVLELSRRIPYRTGGSGTLINNSVMDAFCPVSYLQPSLIGGNYGNFFQRYAVTAKVSTPANPGLERKVVVAFKGKKEVKAILESCSIVMTKEQWLKLPPKHFHDVYVQMQGEQKLKYYELLKNYRIELQGEELEIDNPLVMMMKLYQISQGFLYIDKEDSSIEDLLPEENKLKKSKKTRKTIFFEEQPKVQRLKELINDEISGKKAIIWFNLSAEYTLIETALKELGETYLSIQGGDKNLGTKVREFNKNPNIRFLVCQAKSVNYGITVLGTKTKDLENSEIEIFPNLDSSVYTQIFYSINFSLEVYLQQQDRIHRLGQVHDCHYYRLFANSPIETKIRQAISDKVYLRKEILVDIMNSVLKETL